MKIGILTFHRAHNYGAVLQAFALQQYLKSNGYQVNIIDYRQPFIELQFNPFSIKRCLSINPIKFTYRLLRDILKFKYRFERKRLYQNFTDGFLQLSEKCFDSLSIPDDYDLYIHGSDQIWNENLTGGFDDVLFGNYKTNKGTKVTYAASFEKKDLNELQKKYFKEAMKNFDAVSVREKSLGILLNEFISNKFYNVIDPTLLVDKSLWNKIPTSINEKKYLLIYQVMDSVIADDLAIKIATSLNLRILNLAKLKKQPSVPEFVDYFRNADFVVATSFHAMAFSIIFNKQFYVIGSNTGRDVRYTDLLSLLDISDRLVFSTHVNDTNIDYLEVEKKLDLLKKASKQYLNDKFIEN